MGKPRRQFRLTMPEPEELSLHKQIADTLRLEICAAGHLSKLGVLWWSYDLSNSASLAPGARTALGIIAGIPDLAFLYRGKLHLQEIKRERTGILSADQELVMTFARLAGAEIGVCWDAVSCLRNLDVWGVPRARRTIFPLEEMLREEPHEEEAAAS
jgi:hypothetical protein